MSATRVVRRTVETLSPSLDQALAVIALFTTERRAWAIADIVAATGLGRTTVASILSSLCGQGMLGYQDEREVYISGIRSLELASSYRLENPLVDIAESILIDIRDRLNETAMFAVRWGDYRVNIAQALSSHPLHQDIPLGKRKPLYIGAGGKILLASLNEAELADYLGRVPLERASPTTTTDRSHLATAIADIRSSGYAETFSERSSGGASFGAPVRNAAGNIIAALVVSVPLYRYREQSRDHIRQLLLSGAEEIGDRIASLEGA